MIGPEVAGKLLDEVIYEQVLGCIDLDELYRFELELTLALAECGLEDDEGGSLAKR